MAVRGSSARRSRALENVLVATDLSESALMALRRAFHLPLEDNARISILHVLPGSVPGKDRASVKSVAMRKLVNEIASVRKEIGPSEDYEIVPEVAFGDAYASIIQRGRALDADLLVLGRRGTTGLSEMLIGSTAQRVTRLADIPVLVVNLPASGQYARPVVATDFDDAGRRTLNLALRIAPKAPVFSLVHAYDVPYEGLLSQRYPRSARSEVALSLKREAEKGMASFQSAVGLTGTRWRAVIRKGDPRTVVLEECGRLKADLVALGTHGRSGIANVLMGSVAEWIIEAATCDVLVARPMRFSFRLI